MPEMRAHEGEVNLTNQNNVPLAILKAVTADPYTKGDCKYSVTELIGPARQGALRRKHGAEVEEDVEDRLWSLYGQIAHTILERANVAGHLAEKRLFAEFIGTRISGQFDTLDLENGILSDYKFTTSWGFKANSEPKPEWVAQLNMQAEILRRNGFTVNKLQIIGLLRDHSKLEARRDANYPQTPIVVVPIPMWESIETVTYIVGRIHAHDNAEKNLPECSATERWARPDVWAVQKPGAARATKLHDSEPSAQSHAAASGLEVVFRPGESIRCSAYCSVAKFCTQYQALLQGVVK